MDFNILVFESIFSPLKSVFGKIKPTKQIGSRGGWLANLFDRDSFTGRRERFAPVLVQLISQPILAQYTLGRKFDGVFFVLGREMTP